MTPDGDDVLWSNDWSPVSASEIVWFFELSSSVSRQGLSPDNGYRDLTLHVYNARTEMRSCQFNNLSPAMGAQIAVLDLEYWANVADKSLNSNRIARYLEKLRSKLVDEIMGTDFNLLQHNDFQLESTRPWATRVMHGFGHSFYGRQQYSSWCSSAGLKLYKHGETSTFGKQS